MSDLQQGHPLDCLLVGHHEIPFSESEALFRGFGEHLPGYRDLKLNFVNRGDTKASHLDLFNLAWSRAHGGSEPHRFHLGATPHLGAAYLTSFLNRRGKRAEWVNLFPLEQDELAAKLEPRPVCVAITTTLYVYNLPAKRIVDFVKERAPGVPTVIGGPLIGNHARTYEGKALAHVLRDLGADYFILDSQGEATLDRLVDCLKTGGDPSTVPNLLYFGADGKLVATPVEPEQNDLNQEYVRWSELPQKNLGATILTRTARSCSFKCSFCAYPTRAGALALSGLDTIKRELDDLRNIGGIQNVVFIDDTFNVPLPRFKEICRLMIREQYGFNWFSFFRCSNADPEAVDLMAEAGCKGVLLGIESGSPQILKNMDKFATVEQYARGVRWLKDHGIMTFGSFIVGFPGETTDTVQETIDFINATEIDLFRASIWFAEPGTPIMQRKEQYGIEGHTYQWRHNTMDSNEAVAQSERVFWSVETSDWLPKCSFGFWMIPYFVGEGIPLDTFKRLNRHANAMIRIGLKNPGEDAARTAQDRHLDQMVALLQSSPAAERSTLQASATPPHSLAL